MTENNGKSFFLHLLGTSVAMQPPHGDALCPRTSPNPPLYNTSYASYGPVITCITATTDLSINPVVHSTQWDGTELNYLSA